MGTNTTGCRALAIAAGTAFTGGALTILLHDVVPMGSHPWTMAHTLAILTVAGVILAGELARAACASRHFGTAFGFALAVIIGTGLVVLNSVGRQAEVADTSTLSVEDRNAERVRLKESLARHEKSVETQRLAYAEESRNGGCGKVCRGVEASISVYQAAVDGDQAALDKLGAPEAVAPKAERFAEILALFGADKAKSKAAITLLEPFFYTLLFEYGSIVAWGYAFRRRSAEPRRERSPNRSGERSSKTGDSKVRRFTKEEAAADLVTRLALGERFGSQDELKERYGVAKSTMSDWLREWEAGALVVPPHNLAAVSEISEHR